MGHKVLTNPKIWLAHYDVTGDFNALAAEYAAVAADDTNFGDTTEVNLGGVKSILVEASGRWDAASADTAIFSRVGTAGTPFSFSPDGGEEGETGYFFPALLASYAPGGQHGETLPFTVSARGTGAFVRGTIIENVTSSATGNGTAYQLGAVAAGKKVYCAVHVLAVTGTWTVALQSDNASNFPSATSQASQASISAVTSFILEKAGAVADDWWRLVLTETSAGSITLVAIAGIA